MWEFMISKTSLELTGFWVGTLLTALSNNWPLAPIRMLLSFSISFCLHLFKNSRAGSYAFVRARTLDISAKSNYNVITLEIVP